MVNPSCERELEVLSGFYKATYICAPAEAEAINPQLPKQAR